jgi:multicomponent Na+:H+ antiporter subunit D
VWARAFWGPVPERGLAPRGRPLRRLLVQAPVVVLAVALLAVGLYAQPLYDVAAAAADTLANPQPYIDAVLGPASPTASAR